MDIFDSLFSSSDMLNEQIAREVFDIIPEHGPIIVILDKEDSFWVSDQQRYSEIFTDSQQLRQLCTTIDEGAEPVVSQINDCGLIAARLTVEGENCGYVFAVMAQHSPESTLASFDLLELVLNQIALIGKLISKNNQLHHLQLKQLSGLGQSNN